MKHAKPARHDPKSRRWSEDAHVGIGVGVTIALIAGAVAFFGYVVPPKPEQSATRSVMGPR